jgi:hypothetical protein
MTRKSVVVAGVVVLVVIFVIVRRGRDVATAVSIPATPDKPVQPDPVPTGREPRYVRVQSTQVPPHLDGIVNLEAILAFANGVQQNFVDGRVVPPNGVYGWQNLAVVDGFMAHTAQTNDVGVHYVELDFVSGTPIDTVKVVNRGDLPWKERARNYSLILYDDNRRELFRQAFPADIRDEYVFNI